MKRVLFLLVVFVLLLTTCLAQKELDKKVENTKSKTFNVKDYEGWQKISIDKFSFYVPKDFKVDKKRGIDLGYWGYKTNNLDLMIYSGSRLPKRSSVEENFPTYKEESLYINNIFTNISSYEYEVKYYPYKFIEVAQYYIDKKVNENGMIIFVGSKDNPKELIEKIFLSVELVDNSLQINKKK